jgi:hypothetical protein
VLQYKIYNLEPHLFTVYAFFFTLKLIQPVLVINYITLAYYISMLILFLPL